MAIECDVLVVGAGPAGSSAARAAAKKGLKVICIEKKETPGNPVQCAEGIGAYLLSYLPFRLPKKIFEWKIDGMIFKNPDFSIKKKGGFWEGYSVDRIKLETWIVKEAEKEGATVLLSTELVDLEHNKDYIIRSAKVIHNGREKTIKPKMVIAADGVEATTLKIIDKYKPKKGALVDCHEWEVHNLNLENPTFEQIFVGNFVPGGYAFIFPKSKNSANIGVGGLYPSKHISEYFTEFVELPEVKKQVKNAEWKLDKSRYAVFDSLCEKQSYGNIFLAGDCANHNFKPFIEGILPGIISGDFVGNLSDKLINDKISEDRYNAYIGELFPEFIENSNNYKKLLHDLYSKWEKKDHHLFVAFISELFQMERLDEIREMELAILEKEILLELSKN